MTMGQRWPRKNSPSTDSRWERDVAKVAAAGRTVEGGASPGGASAHVAPTTSTLGRAAGSGHQHAGLAGRTWGRVVSESPARRCHLGGDSAFCRSRFDGGEPGDVRALCKNERTAAGGVHRQSQSVSDRTQGNPSPPGASRATNADRAGAEGAGHRVDRGPLAASQRAGRTILRHRARSAGERLAQGGSQQSGGGQSLSRASGPAVMEPAIRAGSGAGGRCASRPGSQAGPEFSAEPGGSADRRPGLHRAGGRGDVSDAAERQRRRDAWEAGGDRTTLGSDDVDALEATASPVGPLRGGKETQLSGCLDSAPSRAETRCRRTATAPPASTGSLQRSLSTPAGATCVAGRAQLNG